MKLLDVTPMLTVEAMEPAIAFYPRHAPGQVQVIALLCCRIVNLSVSIT
jgi:hypothetical protein